MRYPPPTLVPILRYPRIDLNMISCAHRLLAGIGCSILATFFTAAPIYTQTVGGQWERLITIHGQPNDDGLGRAVSSAGDVDGDGIPDVIVGAKFSEAGGSPEQGSAYIYSGATGSLLWQFHGLHWYHHFGDSVSGADDVDGDGFDDVIVGAAGGWSTIGYASVYSGATGNLIWRIEGWTTSVSGAGDIDKDGFDDFMVGALGYSGGSQTGSAYVYSGASGRLLWQFDGEAPNDRPGIAVSEAGDVDGDGCPDVIVGAFLADGWSSAALIYSGATGNLIWQFVGPDPLDLFGGSVSGAGDVDGDGFDDVIVGAEKAHPGHLTNAGSTYIYSGASGGLIWQFDGRSSWGAMGTSVSGAGDVDGDGFDDVIVGAPGVPIGPRVYAGSAFIFSGATGSLLSRFNGPESWDGLGISVSGAGDINGDGLDDVIVGASGVDYPGSGYAGSTYIGSLNPFLHTEVHQISYAGSNALQLTLDFPTSEAGLPFMVLFSRDGTGPSVFQGLAIPLTQDSVFLRFLDNPNLQGVLDASAQAQRDLHLHHRTPPGAIGYQVHVAAVTLDPSTQAGRMSSIVRYVEIVP